MEVTVVMMMMMVMVVMNTSSELCAKPGTFSYTLPNPHNCFNRKNRKLFSRFCRW